MLNHKIRLFAFIADPHAGSTCALLPPGFKTLEDETIGQNALQRWLWACWVDAQAWLAGIIGKDPYALVLLGDLIEGDHHHSKQIISPDTKDHVNCAIELLDPLVRRATKTYVVRGTECHTNNSEVTVAKALGCEHNPELGIPAWDRLTADVKGVRCVFRHHIGSSIRRNLRATQLSVQLAEEQLEAANNGEPIPRVVGCAHRHFESKYEDDNGLIFVAQPWQVLTRFGHRIASSSRSKPGIYVLDFRDTGHGMLPIVHKRTYQAPQPHAVVF